MTKPIVRIHDQATDKVVDREMTAAEFKIYEADQAADALAKAEAEAKATAKAALLERLGITEEEAQLLIGGN